MRQGTRRHERGFTLVEMLVVITMLGVISVITVVSLGGFSQASGDAACATDQKSLASAEDAALATNGVYLSESDLVAQKFLKEEVGSFDVALGSGGKSYSMVPTGSCTLAVGSTSPPGTTTPTSTTTPSGTTTTTPTTTTPPTTTTSPDTTPPAVTITSCSVPGSGAKKWSASGARGTAPGDIDSVTVTVTPGGTSQSSSAVGAAWAVGPSQNPLAKGTYTCTARQSDAAGNVGSATRTLVVS